MAFFYARSGDAGPLPGGAWELVADEGPVLLIACLGAGDGRPLQEALEHASAIGGIILSTTSSAAP